MAPRVLLVVCGVMVMLSAARAQNVVTSCSEDIGVGDCNDTDGCDYNATYTADGDSVSFSVTVRTDLWVAFTFSLDKLGPNSDIVVGAVDVNGDFFIEDRYIGAVAGPAIVDASQDITDLSAWRANGLTHIEFTRPRVTPESNDEDISLDQPVFFLHAWGGTVDFANRILGQPPNRVVSEVMYFIPANCEDGAEEDDSDDSESSDSFDDKSFEGSGAGMIQASLLVMALMVVVAIFGF